MLLKLLKKKSAQGESATRTERLPKPHNLPKAVGRVLINMGKDPDWIWNLKSVIRKKNSRDDHRYDVRVFDGVQAAEKKVTVENYTSLDSHPELILFEGWYDRLSWKARMKERKRKRSISPSLAA